VSVDKARRATPDEAVRLGSRAIFSGRLLGTSLESETEVIHFEPPRLFATCAVRGPRLTTRFELEPEAHGTRVVVDVKGDVPGGALGAKLAEGFLGKELTASLVRLRAIGEEGTTPRA
jgi:Polyketide cyclase / dehydrase and lipid transport